MLVSGVVDLPLHNPFMVADRAVMLDNLTRGRAMLGVGSGALRADFTMIGLDIMQRQVDHAGAEHDALGALRGRGDEHEGVGDDLDGAAVVLADPCLIEVQAVQVLHELQVLLKRKSGVIACVVVQGRHEHAELHAGRSKAHWWRSLGIGSLSRQHSNK